MEHRMELRIVWECPDKEMNLTDIEVQALTLALISLDHDRLDGSNFDEVWERMQEQDILHAYGHPISQVPAFHLDDLREDVRWMSGFRLISVQPVARMINYGPLSAQVA
jgi:hypothetical protein